MLSVAIFYYYAECRYSECGHAECRFAVSRYADCRGTFETFYRYNLLPFYGNYHGNIVLYHRMIVLPRKGLKLLQ